MFSYQLHRNYGRKFAQSLSLVETFTINKIPNFSRPFTLSKTIQGLFSFFKFKDRSRQALNSRPAQEPWYILQVSEVSVMSGQLWRHHVGDAKYADWPSGEDVHRRSEVSLLHLAGRQVEIAHVLGRVDRPPRALHEPLRCNVARAATRRVEEVREVGRVVLPTGIPQHG